MAGPVTIRSLRYQYAALFYFQQWFEGEAFMDVPLEAPLPGPPRMLGCRGRVPRTKELPIELPTAVQLVDLYVRIPQDPVWANYLWCADVDGEGQRVYVGNAPQHGLEIHRHLVITERWASPVWYVP
jgi:hypothetical protein